MEVSQEKPCCLLLNGFPSKVGLDVLYARSAQVIESKNQLLVHINQNRETLCLKIEMWKMRVDHLLNP